jgi:hypothetical protein
MAAKTYVAIIEDDHEADVRDPDIIKVAALDVYRETILETEGITDDNIQQFRNLPGVFLPSLIEIAEKAKDFLYEWAVAQSLEGTSATHEALAEALIAAGFAETDDVYQEDEEVD